GIGIAGIRILSAKAVFIEACEIFGFQATSGTDFGRGIRDARTTGGTLFVTNTTIRNNAQTAIFIQPSSGSTRITATIDNVWLQGNGNGGLGVLSGSVATISHSIITAHVIGIAAEQGTGSTACNVQNWVLGQNNCGPATQTGTP